MIFYTYKQFTPPWGGVRIVKSPMLIEYKTREVERTWKDRLFSKPWRPFQKIKTEIYTVPGKAQFDKENMILFVHPEHYEKLMEQV